MELFKTKRLNVRSFSKKDAKDCGSFFSDPEVMKFIGDGNFDFGKTSSEAMVEWFIQSCKNSEGFGTWAIVNESNRVIGNCHLSMCEPVNKVEFGIVLGSTYWHKGYGAELAPALLKYGYEKLKLEEIVCTVHAGNLAPKNGLIKLGFKFDREIQHHGISQELYLKSDS